MKSVLVDSGPLVATLLRTDAEHEVCTHTFASLPRPAFTCWPVVTEVMWLLGRNARAARLFILAFESGAIELLDLSADDLTPIQQIREKYASLQPDFTDACLVHLAEREGIDTIFTLDRRDFSVYRTTKRKGFKLLPAE